MTESLATLTAEVSEICWLIISINEQLYFFAGSSRDVAGHLIYSTHCDLNNFPTTKSGNNLFKSTFCPFLPQVSSPLKLNTHSVSFCTLRSLAAVSIMSDTTAVNKQYFEYVGFLQSSTAYYIGVTPTIILFDRACLRTCMMRGSLLAHSRLMACHKCSSFLSKHARMLIDMSYTTARKQQHTTLGMRKRLRR